MLRRLFTTISKKDFSKIALNNPEFNQHEIISWINRSHNHSLDNDYLKKQNNLKFSKKQQQQYEIIKNSINDK